MGSIRVGIVGATGYSGMELIRLLSGHPGVQLTYLAGSKAADETVEGAFPFLYPAAGRRIQAYDLDECSSECDAIFVALPSGTAGRVAADLWRAGKNVIDLSGDLRLPTSTYEEWYGKAAVDHDVVDAAVYGLSEWMRDEIRLATLIANPGCFATATLLALLPLVDGNLAMGAGPIVVDAKSGVSGAGKHPSLGTHFAELGENFYPYRVGRHQHIPEIEAQLNRLTTGVNHQVLLNTQLLPAIRGIYACAYVPLAGSVSESEIHEMFQMAYAEEPFVHVAHRGSVPELKHVRGSNRCHLGFHVDERTHVLQVFSVIDNLQKGAAGQAVQNFNLMHGFAETTALMAAPLFP